MLDQNGQTDQKATQQLFKKTALQVASCNMQHKIINNNAIMLCWCLVLV